MQVVTELKWFRDLDYPEVQAGVGRQIRTTLSLTLKEQLMEINKEKLIKTGHFISCILSLGTLLSSLFSLLPSLSSARSCKVCSQDLLQHQIYHLVYITSADTVTLNLDHSSFF